MLLKFVLLFYYYFKVRTVECVRPEEGSFVPQINESGPVGQIVSRQTRMQFIELVRYLLVIKNISDFQQSSVDGFAQLLQ